MKNRLSRFLLGVASATLLAGATIHAIAFRKVAIAVQQSNLPLFFGNCLKALWIADSSTLTIVAAVLAYLALRPAASSGVTAVFCCVLLAATASILYAFLGAFLPAHMLVASAGAVLVAQALDQSQAGDATALEIAKQERNAATATSR